MPSPIRSFLIFLNVPERFSVAITLWRVHVSIRWNLHKTQLLISPARKRCLEEISMKVNKLIVAVLGLSLLFTGCVSAIEHGTSTYGHSDDHNLNHGDRDWNHGDRDWNHNDHDWLSGGYYSYPSTYYYNYYTPLYTYTYYPTYYYTEPVYYNMPVVYHNSASYPWWGGNIYGFGSTYYSSSSHWTYKSGF